MEERIVIREKSDGPGMVMRRTWADIYVYEGNDPPKLTPDLGTYWRRMADGTWITVRMGPGALIGKTGRREMVPQTLKLKIAVEEPYDGFTRKIEES